MNLLFHFLFAALLASPCLGNEKLSDPTEGWIAFSRMTQGFWQIWKMRPDGSDASQLTFGASDKRHPSWGPDGNFLVYADANGSLFRLEAAGGEPRRLLGSLGSIAEPSISSTGILAYTHVQNPPHYTVEVWTTDLDGLSPRVITPQPLRDLQPAWSPDGRRLALVEHDLKANLNLLIVVNANGEVRTPLLATKESIVSPAWSPDGRSLVYAATMEGNLELFRVDVDDPKPKQLTQDPAADLSPSFSLDGRSIVFVSRRSGSLQVWRMPAHGGEAIPVSSGPEPCRDPVWSSPRQNPTTPLREISFAPNPFDPATDKPAQIFFHLEEEAQVQIQVRDVGRKIVKIVRGEKKLRAGPCVLSWDGTDDAGKRVAAGQYLLELVAQNERGLSVWEPSRESGGEYFLVRDLRLDGDTKKISFEMPQGGLTRVRVGLRAGGMIANLADWQFFPAGKVEIPYSGDLPVSWGDFWNRVDNYSWVSAYAAPENALFVEGEFSTAQAKISPRIYQGSDRDLSVHVRHAAFDCRDFAISATFLGEFPRDEQGLPVVSGVVPLRIDVAQDAQRAFQENSRFEVMLMLDGIAVSEEEDSALPFTYQVDCSRFPEGPHSFLINVSNYQDHYGSGFASFRVKSSPRLKDK